MSTTGLLVMPPNKIIFGVFQNTLGPLDKPCEEQSFHWSLVALSSPMDATIFHIEGNADSFGYVTKQATHFRNSKTIRGGVKISEISEEQVAWIANTLSQVEIVRGDAVAFNCQTWCVRALRLLRELDPSIVPQPFSEARIREEFVREYERWDTGEDTLDEREFPA
ncbi:hypothetical protein OE88DRAFT_1733336 [Heliocybe sulcata]|uniref:PPPDE domain-containing protein n=1 Tax=Heliocybe sulcata TaxID=5364 RepID=A0A5C3NAC9_9AGAM|nr:hypothetical protein OE88DRAFT_1733336 [Heliocybe sulcata]